MYKGESSLLIVQRTLLFYFTSIHLLLRGNSVFHHYNFYHSNNVLQHFVFPNPLFRLCFRCNTRYFSEVSAFPLFCFQWLSMIVTILLYSYFLTRCYDNDIRCRGLSLLTLLNSYARRSCLFYLNVNNILLLP